MFIFNLLMRGLFALPMWLLTPRRTVAEEGVMAPVRVGEDCTPSVAVAPAVAKPKEWKTPEWMVAYSAQVDANLARNSDFYLKEGK